MSDFYKAGRSLNVTSTPTSMARSRPGNSTKSPVVVNEGHKALAIVKRAIVCSPAIRTDMCFVQINPSSYCNLIPDVFPMRVFSRVYMLTACCCLITYYKKRISDRSITDKLLTGIAALELMLIALQAVKWSSFKITQAAQRFCWYLFYIPLLFISVLSVYLGISLGKREKNLRALVKRWGWMFLISLVLLAVILTNDAHQLVYSFRPGFENWDGDYTRLPIFYIAYGWEYAMMFLSLGIICKKCRIPSARRYSWIVLIPIFIGSVMLIMLAADNIPKINGIAVFSISEAFGSIIVGTLECCMCLGLVPSNEYYAGIFASLDHPIHITDAEGKVVYETKAAGAFTEEMAGLTDRAMLNENTVLRVAAIPGGHAYWQNDISWLSRLNEELDDIRSRLNEENELIRLSIELGEKRAYIDERNDIYDAIIRNTFAQSDLISRLAKEALATEDIGKKSYTLKLISFYGTFIKRYANFMLYESVDGTIKIVDVGLAITENLNYLENLGLAAEYAAGSNDAEMYIEKDVAVAVYETFYTVVSDNIDKMRSCYVRFARDAEGRVQLRVNLDGVCAADNEELASSLKGRGIAMSLFTEESDTFVRFTIVGKGGAA